MRRFEPTTEQLAMIENIGDTLDVTPGRGRSKATGPESGAQAGGQACNRAAKDGRQAAKGG